MCMYVIVPMCICGSPDEIYIFYYLHVTIIQEHFHNCMYMFDYLKYVDIL